MALPPELLYHIFLHAWNDPPTLLSAALCCSAWTDPAQRVLHTHVVLCQRGADLNEFDRKAEEWINSVGRQRYRVSSMVIKMTAGRPRAFDVATERVQRVLAVCEGLDELELVCPHRVAKKVLSNPSLSSLRSPTLDSSEMLSVVPGPKTVPFSLERLSMGDGISADLINALLPITSRLISLDFIATTRSSQIYETEGIYDTVLPVFPHTSSTLRHLRIELGAFPSLLLPLLGACANLSSLTVDFAMHSQTSHQRNLLKLGAALPLPATLTHLKLAGFVRVHADLEFILALIRLPNLENLRQIDFPTLGVWVVVGTGETLREEFLRECRERSIARFAIPTPTRRVPPV
ncbi:hypothetical protein RQP46_010763 [Phenoliferia psychrophenolica]